jgi:hypothetical protein
LLLQSSAGRRETDERLRWWAVNKVLGRLAAVFAVLAVLGGGAWREFLHSASELTQTMHSSEDALQALKDEDGGVDNALRRAYCTTINAAAGGRDKSATWRQALNAAGIDTSDPLSSAVDDLKTNVHLALEHSDYAKSYFNVCLKQHISFAGS